MPKLKRYTINQNTQGLDMPLSTGVNIDVCLAVDVDKLEAENERLKCCGNCLSLDNCIETKDCNVDPAGRCDQWEDQK